MEQSLVLGFRLASSIFTKEFCDKICLEFTFILFKSNWVNTSHDNKSRVFRIFYETIDKVSFALPNFAEDHFSHVTFAERFHQSWSRFFVCNQKSFVFGWISGHKLLIVVFSNDGNKVLHLFGARICYKVPFHLAGIALTISFLILSVNYDLWNVVHGEFLTKLLLAVAIDSDNLHNAVHFLG